MYQTGQKVVYGAHGICTVTGLETRRFGKTKSEFYVLQPISVLDSKYYIPADNPTVLEKLRPLMTRQEVLDMLHSDRVRDTVWIADENQRKLRYREVIAGADRAEILSMICCVHRHKREQQRLGKRLHQCDEGFLKDAQKLMNAELAHIMGLAPEEILPFIRREMGLSEESAI